mmetsp:Transcript_5135/g.11177  ORF Transcript_5135/g.11177 Transcript_5135/m.11177 type:complete len:246 (+) Transcript_5135:276-1013(+)
MRRLRTIECRIPSLHNVPWPYFVPKLVYTPFLPSEDRVLSIGCRKRSWPTTIDSVDRSSNPKLQKSQSTKSWLVLQLRRLSKRRLNSSCCEEKQTVQCRCYWQGQKGSSTLNFSGRCPLAVAKAPKPLEMCMPYAETSSANRSYALLLLIVDVLAASNLSPTDLTQRRLSILLGYATKRIIRCCQALSSEIFSATSQICSVARHRLPPSKDTNGLSRRHKKNMEEIILASLIWLEEWSSLTTFLV